jgi:hypothetical protein
MVPHFFVPTYNHTTQCNILENHNLIINIHLLLFKKSSVIAHQGEKNCFLIMYKKFYLLIIVLTNSQ